MTAEVAIPNPILADLILPPEEQRLLDTPISQLSKQQLQIAFMIRDKVDNHNYAVKDYYRQKEKEKDAWRNEETEVK